MCKTKADVQNKNNATAQIDLSWFLTLPCGEFKTVYSLCVNHGYSKKNIVRFFFALVEKLTDWPINDSRPKCLICLYENETDKFHLLSIPSNFEKQKLVPSSSDRVAALRQYRRISFQFIGAFVFVDILKMS